MSRRLHVRWGLLILFLVVLCAAGSRRIMHGGAESLPHTREFSSVRIQSGDTLWSVAEKYSPSHSAREIRAYIKDLKLMNHIENEYGLKAGTYLMIYTEREP